MNFHQFFFLTKQIAFDKNKTKKEFILKNNIFSFYWKYLRMVMQWFFDLSEDEFGFTMHLVGYYLLR